MDGRLLRVVWIYGGGGLGVILIRKQLGLVHLLVC